MKLRINVKSLFIFGLTVIFFLFFQYSKHNAVLTSINVFNQDPYDAVGSFAVFLALFSSVFAFFKPKVAKIAVLSVLVTMVSNIIAMAKFTGDWVGKNGGMELALLVTGMLLLSLITLKIIGNWRVNIKMAILVSALSVLLLEFYPLVLMRGITGGITNALVGTVALFVNVWAWINFPKPQTRLLGIVIPVGIAFGLGLALVEAFGEGGVLPNLFKLNPRFIIVASVFMGIGGFSVLLGYILLGREFWS